MHLLRFSIYKLMILLCATQRFLAAELLRGLFREPTCLDSVTGKTLLIGDSFTRPGLCVRVQCLGNLQLWEDSCHVPNLQGNCSKMPAPNEYLDYPRCCPLYECKIYDQDELGGETEETRTYDNYGTLRKTHIRQWFVVTDLLEGGKVPGSGVKTQFEI